jgi:hypothetical protein
MSDIKGFAAQRGWSDSTLITLLVEYLEDSGTVEDAFTYLNGVADVEDELADEESWVDEDTDDGDDGEGEANG